MMARTTSSIWSAARQSHSRRLRRAPGCAGLCRQMNRQRLPFPLRRPTWPGPLKLRSDWDPCLLRVGGCRFLMPDQRVQGSRRLCATRNARISTVPTTAQIDRNSGRAMSALCQQRRAARALHWNWSPTVRLCRASKSGTPSLLTQTTSASRMAEPFNLAASAAMSG